MMPAPEAIRDRLKAHAVFADAFGRMVQHLQLNDVDFAATPMAVGPTLTLNPSTKTFVGNPEVNQRLREEGRVPFVAASIA